MNLRLVQFNLSDAPRTAAQAIADGVVPLIRQQPGCDRCEFFGDPQSGDYGIVVVWASKQDADIAAGVVAPVLGPLLQHARATGDSRRLFEIYGPRSG